MRQIVGNVCILRESRSNIAAGKDQTGEGHGVRHVVVQPKYWRAAVAGPEGGVESSGAYENDVSRPRADCASVLSGASGPTDAGAIPTIAADGVVGSWVS